MGSKPCLRGLKDFSVTELNGNDCLTSQRYFPPNSASERLRLESLGIQFREHGAILARPRTPIAYASQSRRDIVLCQFRTSVQRNARRIAHTTDRSFHNLRPADPWSAREPPSRHA